MENFWGFNVWGTFNLVAVIFLSLILSHTLKTLIPLLSKLLIPTSVLGGIILLLTSTIYTCITGLNIFNTNFFGGKGINSLEILTYHALALGFIAQSLKLSDKKTTKNRDLPYILLLSQKSLNSFFNSIPLLILLKCDQCSGSIDK